MAEETGYSPLPPVPDRAQPSTGQGSERTVSARPAGMDPNSVGIPIYGEIKFFREKVLKLPVSPEGIKQMNTLRQQVSGWKSEDVESYLGEKQTSGANLETLVRDAKLGNDLAKITLAMALYEQFQAAFEQESSK